MARIAYRCSKCRTRNCFRRYLAQYVRPRHCKVCGHGKFYFDKERNTPVKPCTCDGLWFPHRLKSAGCHGHERVMFATYQEWEP